MIGWLGSIFLAICGLPQAIQCYREGHARGLNIWFLILWTAGEIFTLAAIKTDAPLPYLFLNYGANIVFLSLIWRYRIWERK